MRDKQQCSPAVCVLFLWAVVLGAILITQKIVSASGPPVLPPINKSVFMKMETAPFIVRGRNGQSLFSVVEDKNGNGRLIIYGKKGQKLFDTSNLGKDGEMPY